VIASAASIARRLGGKRQGHNWRCPCLCGSDYALCLGTGEDSKLLAFCHGGCGYNQIVQELATQDLLFNDSLGTFELPIAERLDEERIADARKLYESAIDHERIERYLRSRSITLTSPVLRFLHTARHREGFPVPAMVAPVVDIDGVVCGAHMTFLSHRHDGKANLEPKERQRQTHGCISGNAIRLMDHDANQPLIIAEGVETALSAAMIFNVPAWAAISAGNIRKLELPPTVREVIIAADHDVNGCSQRNAIAAEQRWQAQGRAVTIKVPPAAGSDFNDVLRAKRGL
jgi:putative DNA primase/helicase